MTVGPVTMEIAPNNNATSQDTFNIQRADRVPIIQVTTEPTRQGPGGNAACKQKQNGRHPHAPGQPLAAKRNNADTSKHKDCTDSHNEVSSLWLLSVRGCRLAGQSTKQP